MRNLTITLCLTLAVLLGSAGVSWSGKNPGQYYKLIPLDSEINGNYKSKDGSREFNFEGNTFTYKLYEKDSLRDGAYEYSSCAVTDTSTGEVLHQGNYMLYFNGTSCCYKLKLVDEKLLVMSRVWAKDEIRYGLCPNMNLRVVP